METNSCKRCGECCERGGPTLHTEDITLLREGHLSHRHLVTIRRDEPAIPAVAGDAEPAAEEFLKIAGAGGEWTCCFFDRGQSACTIYDHRPLECRLQECWNPDKLTEKAGKDLLHRTDLINAHDPVREVIAEHERGCSYQAALEAVTMLATGFDREGMLARLTELVKTDLAIRHRAFSKMGLPLEYELFVFGRPLFVALRPFGLTVAEQDGDIVVGYQAPAAEAPAA